MDPVVRKVVLAAARASALRPESTDADCANRCMLLVCFMCGALSGDVELSNALRGVVGLPHEPDSERLDAGPTRLPVVEVDIDAINRNVQP